MMIAQAMQRRLGKAEQVTPALDLSDRIAKAGMVIRPPLRHPFRIGVIVLDQVQHGRCIGLQSASGLGQGAAGQGDGEEQGRQDTHDGHHG